MAKLTASQRNSLPDSAFVFPKTREYPIHDRAHAYAAIKLSGGKPEEAQVRSAVCQKWGIGCNVGPGGSKK